MFLPIVRKKTSYKGIVGWKKPLLIIEWKKAQSPLNPLISLRHWVFRTALLGTNDTALASEFINSSIVKSFILTINLPIINTFWLIMTADHWRPVGYFSFFTKTHNKTPQKMVALKRY